MLYLLRTDRDGRCAGGGADVTVCTPSTH